MWQIFGLIYCYYYYYFRQFSLDFAFNIRGPRREYPLVSLEPNKSDIVNRQSGDEKLKYVLKFYTGVHIT